MISLLIDDSEYSGWKTVSIEKSLASFASEFSLSVTERWRGQNQRWRITPGSKCELRINGIPDIIGYVDSENISIENAQHDITVGGRSILGDLVDCSTTIEGGNFQNISALKIAQTIAEPFGIPVSLAADESEIFIDFDIQQGESAAEAIVRAAKKRKLLVIEKGEGIQLGLETRPVRLPSKYKTAYVTINHEKRFSRYWCKGQQPGPQYSDPTIASEQSGEAIDGTVNRYRPKMIIAQGAADADTCRQVAEWTMNHSLGESVSLQIIYQGLFNGDGDLWQLGQTAEIDEPLLGPRGQYVVYSLSRSVSESSGTISTITWRPIESLEQEVIVPESAPFIVNSFS